jgi:hypothetical protein
MTITVNEIAAIFIINVNNKYLATSGIVNDGGRILDTSRRNTTNASKIEIHNVIFSPASAGRANTQIVTKLIRTHGMIRFTV